MKRTTRLTLAAGLMALALSAGCPSATPLPAAAAAHLQHAGAAPEALGVLIYRGRVQARGADADPLFTYERRLAETAAGIRATHITYTLDGQPAVLQQAECDRVDYTLFRFEEIHSQTGVSGYVEIDEEGTATFAREGRGLRIEPGTEPVVVGPTLFGFVLSHWDALVSGETKRVRFAVIETMRTYSLQIRLLDQNDARTRLEIRPTQALVRLVVPVMHLTFDSLDRTLRRYEGLVPPRIGDGRRELDARVDYTHQTALYR